MHNPANKQKTNAVENITSLAKVTNTQTLQNNDERPQMSNTHDAVNCRFLQP